MTNFMNPLTPLGFCVLMLESRLARARREDGASAVEWVIIAAIVVGICIAVAGILRNALTSKANDIGSDDQQPVTRACQARSRRRAGRERCVRCRARAVHAHLDVHDPVRRAVLAGLPRGPGGLRCRPGGRPDRPRDRQRRRGPGRGRPDHRARSARASSTTPRSAPQVGAEQARVTVSGEAPQILPFLPIPRVSETVRGPGRALRPGRRGGGVP